MRTPRDQFDGKSSERSTRIAAFRRHFGVNTSRLSSYISSSYVIRDDRAPVESKAGGNCPRARAFYLRYGNNRRLASHNRWRVKLSARSPLAKFVAVSSEDHYVFARFPRVPNCVATHDRELSFRRGPCRTKYT